MPQTPSPTVPTNQEALPKSFPLPSTPKTPPPIPRILPTTLTQFPSINQVLSPTAKAHMVDTAMLARGHSTAPKFDPTKPRELRRFFDELELLFGVCNMTDSDLMKKHACIYVDIDSAKLWESLPQHATGISFGEFQKAIHKLYPGSEDDRKWTILDMDKVVGEQLRIGIFDANDLGMYYRSFFNITHFLCTKNRISEAEQSRAFVHGFQPTLCAILSVAS